MKKKLFALLIGTMVLGTLLGGCKQANGTVVESEAQNSEAVVVEETSLDEVKEKDFSNLEFEEIYANFPDDILSDTFNIYLEEEGSIIYHSLGNDEVGYIMDCNKVGEIQSNELPSVAYKITKGTVQDMIDYQKAMALDAMESKKPDDEYTIEILTGDGYTEFVFVDPTQGKSGETRRTRCYPYGNTLQVLEFHYSNEDEEQELERINSFVHFNNSQEVEDFYNELVEAYPDDRVDWLKGTELFKRHWNQ